MKKSLIDVRKTIFAKKCFVLDVFGRVVNLFLLEKMSSKTRQNCKTKLCYENIRQNCLIKTARQNCLLKVVSSF